jgi:hypothetical protein
MLVPLGRFWVALRAERFDASTPTTPTSGKM